MNPANFEYLAKFVKDASGIVLTPDKSYLLDSRLQPVARRLKLSGLDELVDALRAGTTVGLDRDVIEAMTTNESFFFRDSTPFDNFKQHVLPHLLETRAGANTIRIWSAACSTGQEPYSLAMILHEHAVKLTGWRVEIVATDIDTEVLGRAKEGIYSQFEVQRGLPVQLLVKYFEKADDKWQIHKVIRDMVTFKPNNLTKDQPPMGTFDVIFCRNVLIYFESEMKAKVLDGIAQRMAKDGALFLGGAETVIGVTDKLAPMPGKRGIYGLKEGTLVSAGAPPAADERTAASA